MGHGAERGVLLRGRGVGEHARGVTRTRADLGHLRGDGRAVAAADLGKGHGMLSGAEVSHGGEWRGKGGRLPVGYLDTGFPVTSQRTMSAFRASISRAPSSDG